MADTALPTRILASIIVPDTPLITAAIALAREHLNDISYQHIMRSFLFGFAIADKISPLQNRDKEVHALGAILHDLGWDTTNTFISPDKRFEVDGANAAQEFVVEQTAHLDPQTWNKHRLQLLWDAIALHTTPSIAQHKEKEVQATSLGIFVDFRGPDAVPGTITKDEWAAIVAKFPRSGFRDGVVGVMCGLCRTKPETTYDNFVGEFGEELVQGYSRKGRRAMDMIMATVE